MNHSSIFTVEQMVALYGTIEALWERTEKISAEEFKTTCLEALEEIGNENPNYTIDDFISRVQEKFNITEDFSTYEPKELHYELLKEFESFSTRQLIAEFIEAY